MKGLAATVVIMGLLGTLIAGTIWFLMLLGSLIVPLFQTAADETSSKNFVQRLDLNYTIR